MGSKFFSQNSLYEGNVNIQTFIAGIFWALWAVTKLFDSFKSDNVSHYITQNWIINGLNYTANVLSVE